MAGKTFVYEVYILKSENFPRYYIGYTDNFAKRIAAHNNGRVRSTKAYRPWKVVHKEIFNDKTVARRRELKIKSYKAGEAFKRLVNEDMWKGRIVA